MDALTLSTSFAAIVGLLATFQSINDETSNDLNDFLAWLRQTNNENTAAIIESDTALQINLNHFMKQNHDEVMFQLFTLNDLMVTIANRIEGLDRLASTFRSDSGLSVQATDVLRQFVESGSTNMHHMRNLSRNDGNDYILEGASDIKYNEPRFIEDDIKGLVALGLITQSFTKGGGLVYKITRQAVNFIESTKS